MIEKLEIYDITEYYLRDARGWTIKPLVPEFPAIKSEGHLHIVSIEPGAVRGNHIHSTTDEWIIFWGSEMLLLWEQENTVKEEKLDANKAYLVHVPRNMCHACKNISQKESYLLSYYEAKISDYDRETVKKVLIN